MSTSKPKAGSEDQDVIQPVNKHALTPVELQRMQLAKLLKDPSKDVFIPKPPKEKELRPPREMMKNVQGSSAGAGSGEFHVYKQNRRREYERLKLMEETSKKEEEAAEFEQRKREREEAAEAKTAKNRAKRQKKKGKGKSAKSGEAGNSKDNDAAEGSFTKKRKLGDGTQMVFRRPGQESDEEEDEQRGRSDDDTDIGPVPAMAEENVPIIEETKIIIHDD